MALTSEIPGTDLFFDRGILGAVALLSILAAIYLFRLLTKERKEYLVSLETKSKEYQEALEKKTKEFFEALEAKTVEADERLSELSERVLSEAQHQHDEDRQLLSRLTEILESVSKRADNRKGR